MQIYHLLNLFQNTSFQSLIKIHTVHPLPLFLSLTRSLKDRLISLCMYVCICANACTCLVHVCRPEVSVGYVPQSLALHLNPGLTIWLDWLTGKLRNPSVYGLSPTGIVDMSPHIQLLIWGSGSLSSEMYANVAGTVPTERSPCHRRFILYLPGKCKLSFVYKLQELHPPWIR